MEDFTAPLICSRGDSPFVLPTNLDYLCIPNTKVNLKQYNNILRFSIYLRENNIIFKGKHVEQNHTIGTIIFEEDGITYSVFLYWDFDLRVSIMNDDKIILSEERHVKESVVVVSTNITVKVKIPMIIENLILPEVLSGIEFIDLWTYSCQKLQAQQEKTLVSVVSSDDILECFIQRDNHKDSGDENDDEHEWRGKEPENEKLKGNYSLFVLFQNIIFAEYSIKDGNFEEVAPGEDTIHLNQVKKIVEKWFMSCNG